LHPRGRHKARVFREALDLRLSDASWLRDVLLEAARSGEAFQVAEDAWGTHWRLDVTIGRQERSAVVRTIWIVRTGESVPRFVTADDGSRDWKLALGHQAVGTARIDVRALRQQAVAVAVSV